MEITKQFFVISTRRMICTHAVIGTSIKSTSASGELALMAILSVFQIPKPSPGKKPSTNDKLHYALKHRHRCHKSPLTLHLLRNLHHRYNARLLLHFEQVQLFWVE
ncbi:MAG: hypothetical protein ACI8VT_002697 [Saprospiraceae bacterium]|jgi:hypothetical protein